MSTHRHNWSPRGPYLAGDIRHCTVCGRRQQREHKGHPDAPRRELGWTDIAPVPVEHRLRLARYNALSVEMARNVDVAPGVRPALDRRRAEFQELLAAVNA